MSREEDSTRCPKEVEKATLYCNPEKKEVLNGRRKIEYQIYLFHRKDNTASTKGEGGKGL